MIGTSVLIAFTIFVALAVILLDRLKFLTPLKQHLFHNYGTDIGLFTLLLFLNLFALLFTFFRRSRLKHTGQKLIHLDKQVKTGQSALSSEIAEKYEE
ncbi:MAG TPA: hypothetical protein VI685_23570 [Candidatus Angelobacter sp.]